MTPLNLDQLLRVAEEATPGPWALGEGVMASGRFVAWVVAKKPDPPYPMSDLIRVLTSKADALHIATFDPPTVKALIEQNRALVEAVKALLDASPSLIVKAVRKPVDAGCLLGWTAAALSARNLLTTIEANHAG